MQIKQNFIWIKKKKIDGDRASFNPREFLQYAPSCGCFNFNPTPLQNGSIVPPGVVIKKIQEMDNLRNDRKCYMYGCKRIADDPLLMEIDVKGLDRQSIINEFSDCNSSNSCSLKDTKLNVSYITSRNRGDGNLDQINQAKSCEKSNCIINYNLNNNRIGKSMGVTSNINMNCGGGGGGNGSESCSSGDCSFGDDLSSKIERGIITYPPKSWPIQISKKPLINKQCGGDQRNMYQIMNKMLHVNHHL